MATYQAQLDALQAQNAKMTDLRKALSVAIQTVIADQVCSTIGEQFHAHVMALPLVEEPSLNWHYLAGRSDELADTANAFGEAMVKNGFFIEKKMYFNNFDHSGDVELSKDDLAMYEAEGYACPLKGEEVSKEYFLKGLYSLWVSTDKWTELFKAAHEFEPKDEPIVVGENLQAVIDYHAKALDEVSAYAYLELSYTRRTAWMVFVTSHQRTEHPDRKILISGQGHSPESACADALSGEPKPFTPDQIVESLLEKANAESDALKDVITKTLERLGTTDEFGELGSLQFWLDNPSDIDTLKTTSVTNQKRIKELEGQLATCTQSYNYMLGERDEWMAFSKSMSADYNAQGYWAWQGDGTDDLESLTCPVLISAQALRNLVQPK